MQVFLADPDPAEADDDKPSDGDDDGNDNGSDSGPLRGIRLD